MNKFLLPLLLISSLIAQDKDSLSISVSDTIKIDQIQEKYAALEVGTLVRPLKKKHLRTFPKPRVD